MRDVYIVSAVRSAIGRFGGAFKDHAPSDLAAPVMKAALDRAGVEGKDLDLVVFGNVLRAGQGQLVPRQAALKAGIPKEIDGMAIDMVCSSGMMSVMNAATQIKAGEADMILAGGVEVMSGAGFYLSSGARWGYKYLPGPMEQLVDIMFRDGLSDPMSGEAMGDQTERLAAEENISREALDEVAFMSNQRAAEATQKGYFEDEIVPVDYRDRRETKALTADEGIRADTTLETLGNLRTAFKKDGVLTAGNSSQISDGAAALLVVSGEAVEKYGLTPLARINGGAWAAGEPWRFPEAPVPAVHNLQDKTGQSIEDFDLVENNEAFAINSILFNRKLGVSYDQLNVHGGAISLGHPIGCSGARILVTLIHALRQHDGQHGLAAICHGTGGGTAMSVELV
ncbi:MAG TPA: thiolase family protein [Rhodothermales bacterium]|nr:thiolase family protein [Rhodothermales bacterium]